MSEALRMIRNRTMEKNDSLLIDVALEIMGIYIECNIYIFVSF